MKSQLDDYYKGFAEVYIFVHHSLVNKYMGLVDPHIGVMAFSQLNEIEVVYSATPDLSKLEPSTTLKALRKDEYLKVIKNLVVYLLSMQPVSLFNECLKIANSLKKDLKSIDSYSYTIIVSK